MIARVAPALAAALAVLAIAGCGDDDDEAFTGPATFAPAQSQIFVEAILRPEGEQRTAIETPLAALLGSEDPGALVVAELDAELAQEGVGYEADVEPWLGERGGVFFTSAIEDVEGAFVLETTDAEAALAFAEKVSNAADSYEVIGDFLVAGSERAVEAAVASEAGGDALADDAEFDSLLGPDADATARGYVDVPALVADAQDAGLLASADRAVLDTAFAGIADEPVAAVLDAETTGFGLEASYGATELPLLSAATESALLRRLPGDSWLAAGLPEAGEAIGALLERAEEFGVAPDELRRMRAQLRRALGLELRDLRGVIGDGAWFANGEGIFGSGGGVVFETGDRAGAEALVEGLERAAERGGEEVRPLSGPGGETGFAIAVPGAPGDVNVVAGADRIVAAYGEAATAAALAPGAAEETLGESEAFAEAESALGAGFEVSGYLDFAPLVEILGLAAATEPALDAVLPYLESLDFVISGSAAEGERVRQRVYLGIGGITVEPSA